MTNNPQISVIIPVYNSPIELDRCLRFLQRCDLVGPSEIIVIDDGSLEVSDNIEKVTLKNKAQYYRQKNSGPAIARNRGAGLAKGDILVFIDADCVAPVEWISKISQPIRKGECLATTSCYSGPLTPSWLAIFQDEDYRYRMPSRECETYFVNSCNFAVKRNVFLNCSGFPKQRVSEDMVMGMILAQNGTPARYLPDAGVLHDYHQNLLSYLKQRFSFAFSTIQTFLNRGIERQQTAHPNVRSFNPIRTALGIIFNFITAVCLLSAGIFAILGAAWAKTFIFGAIFALSFEMVVHGRFLFFLVKRQGVWQSISYLSLLYLIDMAYVLAIIKGLRLELSRYFLSSRLNKG